MTRVPLALALCCLAFPALAGVAENTLAGVTLAPSADAEVPLALAFRGSDGQDVALGQALGARAALLLPVDYRCRTTCGPALSIVSAALAQSGLRPGADFRLVLVGLNPRDGDEAARAFAQARIDDPALFAATAALTGDAASIATLTQAIGYRYAYDAQNDAFAHPTGVLAITPEGRVARTLSTLALDATDLRLALIEAGEGRVGGLTGRLALLCYGFDAVHGIYTASIERMLKVAGALTVFVIAATLGWLSWRTRPEGSAP